MSTEVITSKTATIQHLFELFGKGNIPAMMELFNDNITWNATNPFIPQPKLYKGKDEVVQFFQTVGSIMDIPVFEPLNFFENGNTLFVNGRFEVVLKKDNHKAKVDWTMRWRFKGDKISEFAEYFAPVE